MTLEQIVKEARKIRKYLVARRTGAGKALAGDCGYASMLLAYRLNKISILRVHESHSWTEFRGVVVDITASQFDRSLKGVYVGPTRSFHIDGDTLKGRKAAVEIIDWNLYSGCYLWDKIVATWGQ